MVSKHFNLDQGKLFVCVHSLLDSLIYECLISLRNLAALRRCAEHAGWSVLLVQLEFGCKSFHSEIPLTKAATSSYASEALKIAAFCERESRTQANYQFWNNNCLKWVHVCPGFFSDICNLIWLSGVHFGLYPSLFSVSWFGRSPCQIPHRSYEPGPYKKNRWVTLIIISLFRPTSATYTKPTPTSSPTSHPTTAMQFSFVLSAAVAYRKISKPRKEFTVSHYLILSSGCFHICFTDPGCRCRRSWCRSELSFPKW